jgi:hypothetical protein
MRTIARWRVATWLFLFVNAAMAAWLISALARVSNENVNCGVLDLQTCQNLYNAGVGIGVAFILLIWLIVFIVMSLLWIMTKPARRLCPVCGETVRKYDSICDYCQYDFFQAGQVAMGRTSPVPSHRARPAGDPALTESRR